MESKESSLLFFIKEVPVFKVVGLEPEIFSRLSSPGHKRLLAPSLIDFRRKPGNRDPNNGCHLTLSIGCTPEGPYDNTRF